MTRTPASPSSITPLLIAALVLTVLLSACGGSEGASSVDDGVSPAPASEGADAPATQQATPDAVLPSAPEPAEPVVGSAATESPVEVQGVDRALALRNLVGGSAPVAEGIADCIMAEVTDEQLAAVDNFSDEWRARVAAADEPSAQDSAVIAVVQGCTGGVEATDG